MAVGDYLVDNIVSTDDIVITSEAIGNIPQIERVQPFSTI